MKTNEVLGEKWSAKYKRSIDCNNPKGFSQRAHCQGRKKNESLNEDFNKCFDKACKLYDIAKEKGLNPKLIQVADYKGDGSNADERWQEMPQHVWSHYVTVIGDTVYDPTAKQFGADKPTEYNVSELDKLWGKKYDIRENVNEDIPPMSELVAMATVASVSVPVLKTMLKTAYKTGKGLLQLKRIANKAGVKLADRIVGEDEEQELPIDMDQIRDFILELESKGHLKPEEADDLRRATQALASGRDTILPNRILQLLTLISR